MAKKGNNLYLIYTALTLMFLCVILYLLIRNYTLQTENAARQNLQTLFDEASDEVSSLNDDRVCMTKSQYDAMMQKAKYTTPTVNVDISKTTERDYKVINDPLYPPLNRTDAVTHTMLRNNVENRNMYVNVNDAFDSYRLVGYLVSNDENKDAGGNNWKLFARQKDRHTADFYMVPANNNYDIKIQIKDEMVVGTRLRDLYTIPTQISFKSPMLNQTPYEYVEISQPDMSSVRYV
jgi:cbb3-type cytochrome oxidase subunit 3